MASLHQQQQAPGGSTQCWRDVVARTPKSEAPAHKLNAYISQGHGLVLSQKTDCHPKAPDTDASVESATSLSHQAGSTVKSSFPARGTRRRLRPNLLSPTLHLRVPALQHCRRSLMVFQPLRDQCAHSETARTQTSPHGHNCQRVNTGSTATFHSSRHFRGQVKASHDSIGLKSGLAFSVFNSRTMGSSLQSFARTNTCPEDRLGGTDYRRGCFRCRAPVRLLPAPHGCAALAFVTKAVSENDSQAKHMPSRFRSDLARIV